MFAGAFSGAFAKGAAAGRGFAASFSSAFAGRATAVVCIAPMRAQAALVAGEPWSVDGSRLFIGGALLIGPAGKVFCFSSPETAARWVDNARNIGEREAALIATIAPEAAAIWKAKKRVKLAVIAGRLVAAAGRCHDAAKRAALLAESDYALSKWG